MRVLIADDESHCRAELRCLLERESDLEIVGEATNGVEALERCKDLRPELLFLDIQMPGLTGLEVASNIEVEWMPQIVFVTAYDSHALKAFDVGAVDYLLKPVADDRLAQCLVRVRAHKRMATEPARLEALGKAIADARPGLLERIVGRKSGRIFVISIEEVYCFEIENQLLFAITEKERYWTNYQMKSLEPRLDPKRFLRIHRESIVNISCIRELAPITRERYELTLKNNHRLNVSRNYLPALKQMLGWE